MTILRDPKANPYVTGSAFHLYEGDISALTTVHNAFPNKDLYFTEQYTGTGTNYGLELTIQKYFDKSFFINAI